MARYRARIEDNVFREASQGQTPGARVGVEGSVQWLHVMAEQVCATGVRDLGIG